MSLPLDDSPEASSSTAADKAISTLRARLCSEDPCPPWPSSTCSSKPYPKHNDIYKKLQASFSSVPGPRLAPHHTPDGGNIIMSNLAGIAVIAAPANTCPHLSLTRKKQKTQTKHSTAETFARSGQETYKSAVSSLQTVHTSISGQINAFDAESASTLSDAAALYDNISYPLSRTICHSENFSRGTIEQHLSVLKGKMAAAEKELASLNTEWMACVDEEAKIMAVTEEVGNGSGSDSSKQVDDLVHEIDGIVSDKASDLEQMDKQYRDLLWKESQKMMQAMMAD